MLTNEGEVQRKELWLSQSRINAYLSCPLYYKLTFIDKLGDVKGNYHTALGNGVHKALEEMYRTQDYSLDLLYRWWDRVCNEGYEEKNGQFVPAILTDPSYDYPRGEDDTKILYNHGRKLLRQYYHANKHDFGKNEIIATEWNFKIPIGKDNGIVLNGYIDRIDRTPSGQLVVIDYKTGKEKNVEELEWDTQLTMYSFAIRKEFGEVEGGLYLHFIKSGNKVGVTRIKPHFDDLRDKVKIVKAGLEAEQFEAKIGPMCRYCSFDCPIGGNLQFRKRDR